MAALLLLLAPIGLLDSTSMLSLCIVPLVALLAGSRPLFGASALVLGVLAANLACGLLVFFGLQSAFEAVHVYAVRVWNDPSTEELIFQIALGLVACAYGVRLAARRERARGAAAARSMTPAQAWLAGAGLTIVGLPGAVPYFAAIDLILRAELALAPQLAALAFYNAVFVAPLFAVLALRVILGARADRPLGAVKRVLGTWSRRAVVALLFLLGAVLVADGIGWFLGRPLLPL